MLPVHIAESYPHNVKSQKNYLNLETVASLPEFSGEDVRPIKV